MLVLVVSDPGPACEEHGGCTAVEGELATVLTVEYTWQGLTPAREHVRHLLGLETGHFASAVEVIELAVTRDVIVDAVREAVVLRGAWDDDDVETVCEALAADMLDTAANYPEGTVLEKHSDDGPPWPRFPADPGASRRPVCGGHPRRG